MRDMRSLSDGPPVFRRYRTIRALIAPIAASTVLGIAACAAADTITPTAREFSTEPLPELAGNLFFAVDGAGSASGLYRLALPSGAPQSIGDTPGDRGSLAVSPDGRLLAYRAASGTLIMDITGRRRFFTALQGWERPTWSADSRRLYFGKYVTGLVQVDLTKDTAQIAVRSVGQTYDHSAAISPGDSVLVWAHHEWSFRIYLQRARVRPPSGVTNQVTIWSTTSGKNDEDIRTLFLDDRRVLMRLTPQNGRGSHLVAVDLLAGRPDTVYTGDYVDELELSPDKRQVL